MSRSLLGLAVTGLAAAALTGVPAGALALPTETITIGATQQHLFVEWRGNGHGHGLSQWGADGQALAHRSYQQILGFYYPATTLTTLKGNPRIRVLISNTGASLTVAAAPHLVVDGITNSLPTTGIRRYRLVANATNLTLQKLPNKTGATWQNVKTGLKSGAAFHRTDWVPVRMFFNGGTSASYYGYLRAVRLSSKSVETVNSVGYDRYVQGVVPYEMPASWPRAATDAQAVAARTYGDWQVHQPMNANYDICDTSMCQVYGGHQRFSTSGAVTWNDFPQAASDTAGQVLRYNGGPVFAQFSASNGGWTAADGVHPYLTARQDSYDPVAGNPNIVVTPVHKISVADLAAKFGLKTITEIDLVRDGHGTGTNMWGGRIVSGVVKDGDTSVAFSDPTQFQQKVNSLVPDPFVVGTTWIELVPTT